jgi:hypothetical protein
MISGRTQMDYATLIFDRVLADVELWQTLRHKDFSSMSVTEQAQWLSNLKGAYNISDLNRVGEAVKDLTERLLAEGYIAKTSAKLDWTMDDIPTRDQLNIYVNNIQTLRAALALPEDTPLAPTEMNKLMFNEANNIERILFVLNIFVQLMIDGYYFCGELYCGEI